MISYQLHANLNLTNDMLWHKHIIMLTNPEVSREILKDFSSTKILFTFARKKWEIRLLLFVMVRKKSGQAARKLSNFIWMLFNVVMEARKNDTQTSYAI